MKLEDIKKDLEKRLSKRRFIHSSGVAASAVTLAERYGADPDQALLAGWIHDCAKELSLKEMQEIVDSHGMKVDIFLRNSRALLHGPAGSILAQTRYKINVPEVQNAIYYHTTGRPHMHLLEKIIFLADYIEPNRNFPDVDILRKKAEVNLEDALLAAYNSTINHLLSENKYIYDLTFAGRNDLVMKLGYK